MKARDLAALAALGIAGKMAYDKFGNKKKDEPAKTPAAKKQAEQEAYDYDARAQKAELGTKGAYLDDTPEFRTKGAYLDDTPELRTKGAYLDERATPAASAASASSAYKKVKDKSSGAVATKATTAKAADTKDDRFVSPEEGAKAYVPRRTPGAADGIGSTFSSTEEGMANYTPRRTPPAVQVPSTTEEGMAAYVPRRPGQTTNQATSSTTEAGMKNYTPRRDPNASLRANAGRPGFDEVGRPLPVATKVKPQATSSSTAEGMINYYPRNLDVTNKAIMDRKIAEYDKRQGAGRAKGGAVKMASGGMASSKMSKPSGASRGDGIAQRGRTRGTLR
jgi:hypothetical protein